MPLTPYERACKNALDVQDACNFSGVLLSFARDMEVVREELKRTGKYDSNSFAKHPVALWYLDKLADLQGRPADDGLVLSNAHDELCSIVEAGKERMEGEAAS